MTEDNLPVPADPVAAELAMWKRLARACVFGSNVKGAESIGRTCWSLNHLAEFCGALTNIAAGRQAEEFHDPYPPGAKRSHRAALKRAWAWDGWTDLDRAAARLMAKTLGIPMPDEPPPSARTGLSAGLRLPGLTPVPADGRG